MHEDVNTTGSFCNGCQTNWSSLPLTDVDGNDEYEFCPLCRTDEHLQPGRPGESFSFNMITGEKIDNGTGVAVEVPLPAPPEYDLKEAEGRASWAYLKAYKAGGHAAAVKAHGRALKSSK